MKKFIFLLTALSVTCFTNSQGYAAAGDIINIQCGYSAMNPDLIYHGGGVFSGTSQFWNQVNESDYNTLDNLKLSDGLTDSGVSLLEYMPGTAEIDGATGSAFLPGSSDQYLMLGYLHTEGQGMDPGYFKFSGLSAGSYNVYIFSQTELGNVGDLNLTISTSVGSPVDVLLHNAGGIGYLQVNENWIKKTVIVGSDGRLTVDVGLDNEINGIQIEAVPEPNSVILLGVGGIIVFCYRNARTKMRRCL
ncbi:MAG: PEP-CTERM sorting domain-containing protein [Chlorobaculum sp.]|jgi:hypothetical protein|nr:PEP-CTERM sorting domain-containing protein [Chlorobaculum sp.]